VNFDELHNELNSFPDDLKYTDQRWDDALVVIKKHERKVLLIKMGFFMTLVSVLVCGFLLAEGKETLAEYTPRDQESIGLSLIEANGFTESNPESNDIFSSADTRESTISKDSGSDRLESKEESFTNLETINNSRTNRADQIRKSDFTNLIEVKPSQIEPEVSTSEIEVQSRNSSLNSAEESDLSNTTSENEFSNNTVKVSLPVIDQKADLDKETIQSDFLNQKDEIIITTPPSRSSKDNFQAKLGPIKRRKSLLESTQIGVAISRKKDRLHLPLPFGAHKQFLGVKIALNPYTDFGTVQGFRDNLLLGAFYEKPISDILSLSLGADYLQINSIDRPFSSTNTSYNYGIEHRVTTVHTPKAHFVSVPLDLGLRLKNRFQIRTGLSALILVQTENILENKLERNTSTELLSSESTKGYRTNLTSLNINAQLGMRYWWSQRNALQCTYYQGLNSFTQSSDKTSRVEISLIRSVR